jgi:glycosyltransferase involved in cell wall biosynthesis
MVSVTICTYNSLRHIDETLHSVFAQTFQDFEIVVVDDGSTDGTADVIERLYPDPRITIVRQRNQTLRVARPVAVAHAKGEFIAFLDHDDVWLPTKLERQIGAARAAPEAALIFSDCLLIDASGQALGRLSDQFDFGSIDLRGTRAHLELLRRGCFVAYPTAFARTAAVRAVGGFNQTWQYVSDYDLWLRLARRYELRCIREPLAKYRVHETQFTQRHSDITLAEHVALLGPILSSASYPRNVRIAIRDNLFGQHRVAFALLLRQRRFRLAARAALGIYRYPAAVRDYCRGRVATTAIGPAMEFGIVAYCRGKDLLARAIALTVNGMRRVVLRTRHVPQRLVRIIRGQELLVRKAGIASKDPSASAAPPTHVWIDGSSLGREQTGYFNLLSELVRRLAQHQSPTCTVHVVTQSAGRAALLARLGADGSRIQFHRIGWRAVHWSDIHRLLFGWHAQVLLAVASIGLMAIGTVKASSIAGGVAVAIIAGQIAVCLDELRAGLAEASGRARPRYTARLVRFLWRRLPAPRRRAPPHDTVEILFWRGRFKWRNSHRIAIVQDMTTRIHPELHTAGNVSEFEEFLGYVQRHAHTIATVSEQSRRDIVDGIAVCPDSVCIMPMPVHPQYVQPHFDRGFVRWHHITDPYVLCVGTVEPRKNLRRLVKAFELLREEQAAKGLILVLVGPLGWDSGFRQFLTETDAYTRVRLLGFVPLEHLPSLYHFASAVICPSVYEGFGIPVLEAMCSSAVTLASRISSLPEVLGKDGMQFDPFDTHDIAGALLRALNLSPTDAATYRRRCRQRAEAHLERLAVEGPFAELAIEPIVERA